MTSTSADGFYNDPLGADFGGAINPMFFSVFPTLQYDSWFTIGAEPGDDDGLNSAFDAALTSLADFNSGDDFLVNTFVGGSIFVVPGANTQGVPVDGKVLIGQFTTSGVVSALVNVQYRNAAQESLYAEGLTLNSRRQQLVVQMLLLVTSTLLLNLMMDHVLKMIFVVSVEEITLLVDVLMKLHVTTMVTL